MPFVFQPNFVEITHNGEVIFSGNSAFDQKSGMATINVKDAISSLNNIFNSFARYIPFRFKFYYMSNGKFSLASAMCL